MNRSVEVSSTYVSTIKDIHVYLQKFIEDY